MTAGRAAAAAPPHPSAPRRPFGRNPVHLLLAPTLLFLLVFFGYPIARLLSLSFFDPDFTWKYYTVALTAPVYLAVLRTTIDISLQTTLLCLILGYPLAYALATASERARNLVIIAVVLPYFTSILVRSYAWLVILGRHGLLNEAMVSMGLIDHPIRMIYNTTGVVIGMSHIMLPIMVLALYSVMRGIDLDLMKVSESLGANRVQSFLRIYFPLSLPGIGAGVLLVFIFSVGFYVTPALLGGLRDTMLSMLIATQIQELLRWGFAGALSLILLVVTLCLFLVFNRLMGLDRIWGGDVIRERRTARLSALPGAAHLRRAWFALGAAVLTLVEEVALAAVRILRSPLTVWRRAARPGWAARPGSVSGSSQGHRRLPARPHRDHLPRVVHELALPQVPARWLLSSVVPPARRDQLLDGLAVAQSAGRPDEHGARGGARHLRRGRPPPAAGFP